MKLLEESGTQCVTIGTRREEAHISSVSIDDFAAAKLMTEHIIGLGYRRIGFIKGSPDQLATPLRLAGYKQALADAGIEYTEDLVVEGRFSYRSGLAATEALLALEHRPTAIFASNDDMAAATVATAHRHHIDIPRHLTVCGFDDTLLATTIWPEITTIHQPITAMSQAAIDLLEKRIRPSGRAKTTSARRSHSIFVSSNAGATRRRPAHSLLLQPCRAPGRRFPIHNRLPSGSSMRNSVIP